MFYNLFLRFIDLIFLFFLQICVVIFSMVVFYDAGGKNW